MGVQQGGKPRGRGALPGRRFRDGDGGSDGESDLRALTGGQPATKRAYLRRLARALKDCPRRERQDALAYYSEIIDDLTEGEVEYGTGAEGEIVGVSEAEAIAGLESPESAAASIVAGLPAVPRSITWARRFGDPVFWFLAVVGSPMWLAVLAVVVMVTVLCYCCIWMVILLAWAVVVGGVAVGICGVALCTWGLIRGLVPFSLMVLGIGCASAVVGVLLLVPVAAVTGLLAGLSRRCVVKFLGLFFTMPSERGKRAERALVLDRSVSRARRGARVRAVGVVAGMLLAVGAASFLGGYALSGFNISTLNQKLPIGELRVGSGGAEFTT